MYLVKDHSMTEKFCLFVKFKLQSTKLKIILLVLLLHLHLGENYLTQSVCAENYFSENLNLHRDVPLSQFDQTIYIEIKNSDTYLVEYKSSTLLVNGEPLLQPLAHSQCHQITNISKKLNLD